MRALWLTVLLCLGLPAWAEQVKLQTVRIWAAPDNTRVVFDVSGPVQHKLSELSSPDRVVVDIQDTLITRAPAQPTKADKYLKLVRNGVRNQNDLRIVLDLKQKTEIKSFLLPPNQHYGHRLVIDLYEPSRRDALQRVSVDKTPPKARDVVIAIDAGHGGEDPGARGPGGTNEKDVVLQIAKRLASLINKEYGMKAVLIREGDYYISLRKRIEKARQARADLFISIHADAFRDSRVHGSSVYILSQRGATSEAARWLAEQENASDLIGGVSLDVQDDVLASVLLDLSQTASLEASIEVADRVLDGLKSIGKVHKRDVQAAGFAVLKSPDIPSLLIETAYISNPGEERNLRNGYYQAKLARAVLNGIRGYFYEHAPDNTLIAMRKVPKKHIISRGDTLSGIAQRYQISTKRLRDHNGLKSDIIKVGQTLTIPSS